jgi:UTP pyrophosphatase
MESLKYLLAYPVDLRHQVAKLIEQGRLARTLQQRYPYAHGVRTDRALFHYLAEIKTAHLRSADGISKALYDSKIHVVQHALGLHSTISRVQGGRLKAKHEIRISSVFRDAPPEFLRMIAVHELAHLKEREHNKSFYQLCEHMEPDYHQLEFDVRLYLTHLERGGERLWVSGAADAATAG